ncbi:ferric reductase NAD binding domain-containing protein, partial [Favolaschia claudopus]
FLNSIILGGAYYHANSNGLGYYIWPSLVVWGFDRSLRFIRIFFVNGGVLTLFSTKSSPFLRAKIEVISPQFLRVTVRRPDYFRWSPGQLAYLSIPRVSAMPWETHPFTIASIDGDIPRAAAPESPGEDSSSEKVDLAESEVASAGSLSHPGYSKKLVFLLRVHDGFTRRMLHAACSPSPLDDTFNAYIDGPYCAPPTVRGFETVLLFGGGSGVSFILPLFLDVIKGANTATNSICRRVVMIWAVRHQEHITAISEDLLDALAGVTASLQIDIRIHVTAATRNSESDAEKSEGSISSSETKKHKILDAPCVRLLSGRPDVATVIKSEVAEASGSISVNVCGTAGLAENVRTALRTVSTASDILHGGPSISLHVEAFGM